jgi:transcriptional regulator with XRE-family HTH domain
MDNSISHWTEKSTADFLFRIGSDFMAQIECKMGPLKQSELAERMGVSKGRVSQIFNNPGNLTLGLMIKCARAVGMKPAVVAYDDGDRENKYGPVHSEIFQLCWQQLGKPRDVWSIRKPVQCTVVVVASGASLEWHSDLRLYRYRGAAGANEVSFIFPEKSSKESASNQFESFVAPNLPSIGMVVTN